MKNTDLTVPDNNAGRTEAKRLLEVLAEIRERYGCEGQNLYLWDSSMLIPFEEIEADPDYWLQYSGMAVWDWRQQPTVMGALSFDLEPGEAIYIRLGCVINCLHCYGVIAEVVLTAAHATDFRFGKSVAIKVDNSTRPIPMEC